MIVTGVPKIGEKLLANNYKKVFILLSPFKVRGVSQSYSSLLRMGVSPNHRKTI